MTVTLTSPPAPDAGIKRDRYGRYLLPHPETGREQPWTRATTLANTLADRYGLEQWAKRNVALGIGARQDLYAQAASCTIDDKTTLNQIVTQAEEAASSKAKANLGTALHRFTERVDAGETIEVPEPWRADVDAYQATMAAARFTVVPGWIERVLVVPDIGVAGTCDRLLDAYPLPMIADLKTGADVIRYGMTEIALQLAIYAHATHWWDPATSQLHPMPDVDQTGAVVMHLPVGKATCTLYEVDIAAGWEAVQLAVAVREWRKRNDLASQIPAVTPAVRTANGPGPAGATNPPCVVPAGRATWIRARVQQIVDHGHGNQLAALWTAHPDVPTFKNGGPQTAEHVDRIADMCDRVEKETGMPFGESDPTIPAPTKEKARATA